MSTTTKKHRAFISEPMGEKPVTELAGIGEVLGKRLTEAGYSKAYVMLGQFLILKKDERSFKDWLKGICGANVLQQAACFQCLKGYCEHFV